VNDDCDMYSNDDHLANSNDHGRMAQNTRHTMKTYNNFSDKIFSLKNLILAWKKARKGKTKINYIQEFEENLTYNLKLLHDELKNESYIPQPLESFTLRDPKTRKISKADFRDRVVHHALVRLLEPIFDPTFIYDSCANRKGKGNLFAIQRFDTFARKVSKNNTAPCFVLKADIKHYFHEVKHEILLGIIKRKITDEKVLRLIEKIIENGGGRAGIGMPLGNLTSQFFANVYLNELDYFIKHQLKVHYYIRYVDDFVAIHKSKQQLEQWKQEINNFLRQKLKIELHPEKSHIIPLSRGIDFVGFRNFYYYKLLRKRNIRNMETKIKLLNEGKINYENFIESFQGWNAYAEWANSHNKVKNMIKKINKKAK